MYSEQREQFFKFRKILDNFINKIVEEPKEINENLIAIRPWIPANYSIDDVRMYEGNPYKCVQAHDSTINKAWTPDKTPALWIQYHGTTLETARPWIPPTGAHDIYKVGEYMTWTDNSIYKCLQNTNFSPEDYPQAWIKC